MPYDPPELTLSEKTYGLVKPDPFEMPERQVKFLFTFLLSLFTFIQRVNQKFECLFTFFYIGLPYGQQLLMLLLILPLILKAKRPKIKL